MFHSNQEEVKAIEKDNDDDDGCDEISPYHVHSLARIDIL